MSAASQQPVTSSEAPWPEARWSVSSPLRGLHFDRLLVEGRWRRDMRMEVGCDGRIVSLVAGAAKAGDERFSGWTVPGVPNVHCHAFQRALAGLAEGAGATSFWGWRKVMYNFLERLEPQHVEAIAAQLYVELLKGGFTCVGEFHYLHNPPGSGRYDDEAEMSRRILAAARTAGIALIHMPVIYEVGGFGGEALSGGQQRFCLDLDGAIRLKEVLEADFAYAAGQRLGWAVHSLRAISEGSFRELADFFEDEDSGPAPIHIHVAEQEREVHECLAAREARPVEWLVSNAPVDPRWCLVHATHMDPGESAAVAASGATVGLCPMTEANLGDGLFPLPEFVAEGGRFGVGTDSNVARSVAEELRMLEYGQRLRLRRRAVFPSGELADDGASASVMTGAAGRLLIPAFRDGCRALAYDGGRVKVGARADLVVLDPDDVGLVGRDGHAVLDSWIFTAGSVSGGGPVKDVLVSGQVVIRDGHHQREDEVKRNYVNALAEVVGGTS